MATFRTDRETGRTVISSENRVGSDGMTDLERANVAAGYSGGSGDPRFTEASRDPRGVSTFEQGSIASVPLTFDQFMTSTGRSATNPYGDQGFFSRALGIDPSKISYANNIAGGGAGIAQLNALAYDRYMNPAARTNIFGDQVGGDPTTGQIRYGVQPGDLTRFGRAVPERREGIAGVLDNLPFGIGLASRMFGSTPARVPGFDAQEVVPQLGLGGPQPGEGMDAAQARAMEDAANQAPDELILPSLTELPEDPFSSLPSLSSIPTEEELRQERIRMTLDELNRGTADFPEQYEVAPTASSIPTAYELTKAQGINFPPRILPGSVFPGDEMNVNAPGLF